ncbi:MAG: PASTA domain-containing protein [Flavobacteriales bacterium]|nr:PASTA domain-containing protein [Flavobacteriales bacterium]
MFKFFYSKKFLINLAAAILFIVLAIWGIFKFIDSYTLHGETISVPSLAGLTIDEVEEILTEKKLRYTILDSVYNVDAEKGIVLEQDPSANDLVKENRTIYITTSKIVPPKISMPNVVDMSLRLAVAKLESYGLKVKTKYIPSEFVNVVIRQEINGEIVELNDKIEKNSLVLLSVGKNSNEMVLIPYLLNLTKKEAESKLMGASLNIGFDDYESCQCKSKEDTLNARVYRQSPMRSLSNPINMGSLVDLYFTCDSSKINFDATMANDTTKTLPKDTLDGDPK